MIVSAVADNKTWRDTFNWEHHQANIQKVWTKYEHTYKFTNSSYLRLKEVGSVEYFLFLENNRRREYLIAFFKSLTEEQWETILDVDVTQEY